MNIEQEEEKLSKDRFLATMSHELLTPLNAIIGFTGTLLMGIAGPLNEKQKRQLETVSRSARRQLAVINQLVELARIEFGNEEINLEPVACGEVIVEVARALRSLAEEKQLKFEIALPEDEIILRTDRLILGRILTSLADNAIKFTPQGSVRLELRKTGGTTEFAVTDTGVGIRTEDQPRLFEPFARLAGPESPCQEGSGLGLHLGRKLATLLGGRICFSSEAGNGSQFVLAIPTA